jgi:Zn-finger nucleic acid-binding protein
LPSLSATPLPPRAGAGAQRQAMTCPKCISPMVEVSFHGITVERCTSCQGLWFDEFKKEELEKLHGAEALDIGAAAVGRVFNKVDMIDCPHCGTRMIRMVDLKQPHIWFEHCKLCGGSFFDAGEFRDLKSHSLADFFRGLRVGERK